MGFTMGGNLAGKWQKWIDGRLDTERSGWFAVWRFVVRKSTKDWVLGTGCSLPGLEPKYAYAFGYALNEGKEPAPSATG